jgi:uncharacterized membrane protein
MRKRPLSFVVSALPDRATAEQALASLKSLAADKTIRLADAAVVVKSDSDRVEIFQQRDLSVGEGIVGGGVAGVLAGVLLGFPMAIAAAGVAAGAGIGAFDRGIDDGRMRKLGADLEPGQAALCVLVGEADWALVRERMAPFGGELLVAELTPEAEAAIRAAQAPEPS